MRHALKSTGVLLLLAGAFTFALPTSVTTAEAASCRALQGELRTLERAGGSRKAAQRLRQQQAALSKLNRAMSQQRCGSRRNNVCRQYEAAKRQMLGNIRVYQRRAGGGNEARKASLRRTISRQCSGNGSRDRNVLDVLFGGQKKAAPQPQQQRARVARARTGDNVNRARRTGTRAATAPSGLGSRAMCVRLSDGYFWPVGQQTRRRGVAESEKECQAACPGQEVALYVHPFQSETDQLVSARTGAPYSKLETAHAYRSSYNAEAQCGVGVERRTIAAPLALPRSLRLARMEAAGLTPLAVLPMRRPAFGEDGRLVKAPEAPVEMETATVRVVGPQFLSDRLNGSIDPDQARPSDPSEPS